MFDRNSPESIPEGAVHGGSMVLRHKRAVLHTTVLVTHGLISPDNTWAIRLDPRTINDRLASKVFVKIVNPVVEFVLWHAYTSHNTGSCKYYFVSKSQGRVRVSP